MKKWFSLFLIAVIMSCGTLVQAQDSLPYREIPVAPETYSAATVAARLIDGLGFRFYWATEGLREEDISYRPNAESRSVEETVEHIYSMVMLIRQVVGQEQLQLESRQDFEGRRRATLSSLWETAKLLRHGELPLDSMEVNTREGESLPFWNFINGPIADCIWHCGQIASFRRSSGNPFNAKVSLFYGELKE
jgi:hypothetical protein